MGAGGAPWSHVERSQAGLPIDSGRELMPIEVVAQARALDMLVEMSPP
jgi:hypothetical protein